MKPNIPTIGMWNAEREKGRKRERVCASLKLNNIHLRKMNILLWMKRTTDKQHQEQYNQQKPHRKLFWKENKSESVYFKKDINIIYIHKEEQTSRRLRFSQFSIAFGDFQSEAKENERIENGDNDGQIQQPKSKYIIHQLKMKRFDMTCDISRFLTMEIVSPSCWTWKRSIFVKVHFNRAISIARSENEDISTSKHFFSVRVFGRVRVWKSTMKFLNKF